MLACDAIQSTAILRASTEMLNDKQLEALDQLASVKYDHLASVNLLFDLERMDKEKIPAGFLELLQQKNIMHLLWPDSFYSG